MYEAVLTLHSVLRWVVILAGLLAVSRAAAGWSGHAPYTTAHDRTGLVFVAAFDLQVLAGLVMYLFTSPITTAAFLNLGGTMQNSVVRFWVVEHPTAMLLGLVLAHLGRVRVRAAGDGVLKHRRAAMLYGCAVLLVLVGTPWPFMPVARPLWPW